jgi:cytochrome c oxidase cbb3-type subunit IV
VASKNKKERNMDTNDIRILVTLAGLCLFIVLLIWSWLPSRRSEHDEAAQLPFWDDSADAARTSAIQSATQGTVHGAVQGAVRGVHHE